MVQSDSLTNRSQIQLQPTEDNPLLTLYYQNLTASDLIELQTLFHKEVTLFVHDECTVHLICEGHIFARLRRLPGPSEINEISPLPSLTDREQTVLEELRQGLSNQEISQALAISEKTVEKYVSRILGKFKVQSRARLVWLLNQ